MKNSNKILIMLSVVAVLISGFFLLKNIFDPDFCLACNGSENKLTVINMNNQNNLEDKVNPVRNFEIQAEDVVKKIENQEKITLLDVRTVDEYSVFHLENSKLLPVDQINQENLSAIGLGDDAKDQEIYVYCRSGARSANAYEMLKSLGYTNVKSIAGGMNYWLENNLPFVTN